MSTNKRRPLVTPEDLEDTAELPCLPAADSPTDTWVAPQIPSGPAIDDVLRSHQEEIGSLRSNLASVTESRGQLETNLGGLTANLRELETRLHSKSEQLSRYEREVGARDRRIADLERDLSTRVEQLSLGSAERDDLRARFERTQSELANLTQLRERQAAVHEEVERERGRREAALLRSQNELAELHLRVAGHNEVLQQVEGRRQIFDSMLREREQMLDERDVQLQALQNEFVAYKLAASTAQEQLAGERGNAQTQSVETQRQLTQARDELAAQKTRAQQAQAALEAKLAAHQEQQQILSQRLTQQLQQAETRQQELTAGAAAAATAIAQLEAQLAQSRQDHGAAQRAGIESENRIAVLEREIADHAEAMRAMDEQLRGAQAGNETLRGDLAAAEDLIRTSESEMQQRDARLARLESNEVALRSKLEAVGRSLDERNALIARLEAEAASSAAVLGNIQNNLERLDHESAGRNIYPGNFGGSGDTARSGSHAAPSTSGTLATLDGKARLLVRTDGDAGIVHVLGRRTTIGRTPDNDLRIDAEFISRHHAVVLITASSTVVEDLNSTNGVFVNNKRITRRQLNEGDLLTIGKTGFRFVLKPAADSN